MLTKTRALDLFPTRLVTFEVAVPGMNDALVTQVLERSQTTPSVPRGERVGWQSGNDFFTWSPAAATLGKVVADAVMTAHAEAEVREVSLLGWANLFTRGVYFNPHHHADAAWSGVYYADAGDSSDAAGGTLLFRDPRAGAAMVTSAANRFDSASTYRHLPRTGELLVFPAWLLHWVTPYQSDRPRVSVSFNAR